MRPGTQKVGGGDSRCRRFKSWVGGASWRRNDSPFPATLARPNSGSGRRGRRACFPTSSGLRNGLGTAGWRQTRSSLYWTPAWWVRILQECAPCRPWTRLLECGHLSGTPEQRRTLSPRRQRTRALWRDWQRTAPSMFAARWDLAGVLYPNTRSLRPQGCSTATRSLQLLPQLL